MKTFHLFFFALSCLVLQAPLPMNAQSFKTESGFTEFKSEVPLHSFRGSSEYLVGKISLADSTVDFYLDLTTLDTGNNKRDKDMQETLNTEKFPFAEFYGKLSPSFDFTTEEPQSVRVTGNFTIHDVTKEISIDGTLQRTDKGLKVTAAWTLDMTAYNIKPPGILFYRVDKNIDIQIKALLEPLNQNSK